LSRFVDRSCPTTFPQRKFYRVPIQVNPQNRLADITGKAELRVNSIHSQAIDKLGVSFTAVGHDCSGLIQAIEHTRYTFLMGVQLYPEFLVYRRFARKVFDSSHAAARQHAITRDDFSRETMAAASNLLSP
jgi:putative glutamine amidotransferase